MTVLYRNPGYNEVSYKGTALYYRLRVEGRVPLLYCILLYISVLMFGL